MTRRTQFALLVLLLLMTASWLVLGRAVAETPPIACCEVPELRPTSTAAPYPDPYPPPAYRSSHVWMAVVFDSYPYP